MDGTPPLYRRSKPTSLISFLHDGQTPIASIDLTNIHLPPYGEFNTVAEAVRLFDARAGAAVKAAIDSMRKSLQRTLGIRLMEVIKILTANYQMPGS